MKLSISKIFKKPTPIIGMLHLDYLLGAKEFKGLDFVINKAKKDIDALQDGGIDGILIENWKEDSIGEFVSSETAVTFAIVTYELSKHIKVPFGINVLNNDYKVALSVAKLTGAAFVELDVFVDHVKSDFKYSPLASKNPFEIKLNPQDIHNYAKEIGAQNNPLFVFIQPKHYKLIDPSKPIEKSAKEAAQAGAAALLITKATGEAPTLDLIKRAKKTIPSLPVGIGSGFSAQNASEYFPIVDFAVVGSALKVDGIADNPVDKKRVMQLMNTIKK